MSLSALPRWPTVYGGPSATGMIRSVDEDFVVDEILSFAPSGSGEHVFLNIEKTGENTEYVARQLARLAAVKDRDVGYAGLKDRHAVATQWFSVWLPGKPEPDWRQIESARVRVLSGLRHARKLTRGALLGNRFRLLVRDWNGDAEITKAQLELIRKGGIANYFGPQRFGHDGDNIAKARALFQGGGAKREQRSLYLSAARSYLFNRILSCRVERQIWNKAISGDVLTLDGSNGSFHVEVPNVEIERRINAGELHPTGPLWGYGDLRSSSEAHELERKIIADETELAEGLIRSGVAVDRRPLRVNVTDLAWQWLEPSQLQLSFALPPGSYATALLREIITFES